MKLKIPLLTILSLLTLTLTSYAQMQPESQNGQNNAYGIEPEQPYPGSLILELMEIAEQEIDAAVGEAYAEGYKAAMVRYAPDATVYKSLAEILQTEIEAERQKNRYFWPAVGITAGLSFIGGLLFHAFAFK